MTRLLAALTLTAAACASDEPRPFTDGDLESLRASEDRFIVYVWSPHMPLSVDGWAEIYAAAGRLDIPVVPLLFAGSEAGFAAREAARVGIPEDGLREAVSRELRDRDALVHAPALLVFDGDRVSPVLPGYRNADGYREFIEDFLGW